MKDKTYFVYMISSQNNKALYTGVTSNFEIRVYQHKNKITLGFTSRYNCYKFVWFESTNSIEEAIKFEKKLKAGSRRKKEILIRKMNPEWKDLPFE